MRRCHRVERTSVARNRTRREPAAAWYRRRSGRLGGLRGCERSGECRCDGRDPRHGRGYARLLRRRRPWPARRTQRVPADAGVRGQAGVVPCPPRRDMLLVRSDAMPGREPELGVLGRILGAFQHMWRYVGLRKVGYRIATGLEEQDNILAFGDPTSSETYAHAPA